MSADSAVPESQGETGKEQPSSLLSWNSSTGKVFYGPCSPVI